LADKILNDNSTMDHIISELSNPKTEDYWVTRELGEKLNIDIWPYIYDRQLQGHGNDWLSLMRTESPERIDQVLKLAESTLPLDKIATGPALHNGFGPDYALYGDLDFVLQDLKNWPGKGWVLLQTGLRSPVIRHRNLTITALKAWEQKNGQKKLRH